MRKTAPATFRRVPIRIDNPDFSENTLGDAINIRYEVPGRNEGPASRSSLDPGPESIHMEKPMRIHNRPAAQTWAHKDPTSRKFLRLRNFKSSCGSDASSKTPRIDWERRGRRVTKSSIRASFIRSSPDGTRIKNRNENAKSKTEIRYRRNL